MTNFATVIANAVVKASAIQKDEPDFSFKVETYSDHFTIHSTSVDALAGTYFSITHDGYPLDWDHGKYGICGRQCPLRPDVAVKLTIEDLDNILREFFETWTD